MGEVVAIKPLFAEIPEVMEFESWWNERGGVKRYMSIVFIPAVGQFHVQCDDSKVPLTIAVSDRHGKPLQAWDLHVGATIAGRGVRRGPGGGGDQAALRRDPGGDGVRV